MGFSELLAIAFGLSMDSLAVSISKGLSLKKLNTKNILTIALFFSVFHVLMITIGFFLGSAFSTIIQKIDHWLAFVLLLVIGINMIKESFEEKQENVDSQVDFKTMFALSIAISIDAFAVGITFAFFEVNLTLAALIIGLTVFILSILGTIIGNKFKNKFNIKVEVIGGIILILIGIKILLEHLGIIELLIK